MNVIEAIHTRRSVRKFTEEKITSKHEPDTAAGGDGGSASPQRAAARRVTAEVRLNRARGLNTDDKKSQNRFSHENKEVKTLYETFLGALIQAQIYYGDLSLGGGRQSS